MKLTQSVVHRLVYRGQGKSPHIVWDDQIRGFGVRIYPSGRKVFLIDYYVNRRRHRIAIGPYGVLTVDQARKMAREKLVQVIVGHDPAEEKHLHQGATITELANEYLEKYAKIHKRSWSEDERRIQRTVLPTLSRHLVLSVTRHDITKIHEQIGQANPYEANRILALLSVMFEFARKRGYVPDNHTNPARGIEKFREQRRDRWVKPEEMPRLAQGIDQEPNIYIRAALWLYILTGVRKMELLRTAWKDVDLDRAELRLPETKSGRTHYVPLSKPALEILQGLPRQEGNPFVFPGLRPNGHLVNIEKPWNRIRKSAELEDVRLHDLRRTVGSWLASAGHSIHIVGKILGHSDYGTTQKTYAHLSQDPLRTALEEHGEKVMEIVRLREAHEQAG